MKKDEILAKARAENSDEMENFTIDKSMTWAFVVLGVCLIVFSEIRQRAGERMCDFSFSVALAASVSNFYRYAKLKNAKSFFMGIITSICAVIFLILFILGH